MGLLDSLRRRFRAEFGADDPAFLLQRGEALLRAGGATAEVHRLGELALERLEAAEAQHNDDERVLQLAAASLLVGDLERASRCARSAAEARPYDVDSRIVHGNVRLARNELDAAAHEFDAVIEEFGADRDAAAGRRAVILARGEGPYDELAAGTEDWEDAATLLVELWELCGVGDDRLHALNGGNGDTLNLLRAAIRRLRNDGSADGAV